MRSWFFHNVVAHPVSELCWWLGYIVPGARAFGDYLHDYSIPEHEPGTRRG